MVFGKTFRNALLASLATAGCLVAGLPMVTQAQGLPGLTLCWTGRCPKELNYRLDFGGRADNFDRYRLRIPGRELNTAVSQITIAYPDYFTGSFDVNNIQVYVRDREVALKPVTWDQENRRLVIEPVETIGANQALEVHLSNVKNPRYGGMFYFNASVQSPGDLPLLRYVGTWLITID
ncbi:MAG: DUF2808 domain-containing protein [Cyanobacteria bacterium]|nr:DUF2808 domain-containing protein [Cyanobacteriota bacterium]MDW8202487.1 DUF2808 domain-containing protein [Cyanobacteriota bacterium SKYGB_h_bin112]